MDDGPGADDLLNMIEGIGAIASILDAAKQALVERGWSDAMAERAAVETMVPIITRPPAVWEQKR